MPYQYSVGEIAVIQHHLDNYENDLAYRAAADFATDPDGTPKKLEDAAVIAWLNNAADVNAGVGLFSRFISEYSSQQATCRYGSAPTVAEIQQASNNFAISVLNETYTTKANAGNCAPSSSKNSPDAPTENET